jgi:hypothetical protein
MCRSGWIGLPRIAAAAPAKSCDRPMRTKRPPRPEPKPPGVAGHSAPVIPGIRETRRVEATYGWNEESPHERRQQAPIEGRGNGRRRTLDCRKGTLDGDRRTFEEVAALRDRETPTVSAARQWLHERAEALVDGPEPRKRMAEMPPEVLRQRVREFPDALRTPANTRSA